jgi:uncharacterized protein YuzE
MFWNEAAIIACRVGKICEFMRKGGVLIIEFGENGLIIGVRIGD